MYYICKRMKECYRWDFTIGKKGENIYEMFSKDILIDCFKNKTKQYSFQLEMSDLQSNTETVEGGYIHYQGRISLIKKKSLSALIKFFNDDVFKYVHWSPTSSEVAKRGDDFYVTKDDTRLKGPWKDSDKVKVLTKQMELFNEWGLLNWQQELKDKASQFDLRVIDLIYDAEGNKGKSLFSEHMEYEEIAEEVPPFRLMDDIFQWVAGMPIRKCYIFDMPRGMKKDKLADFYAGIEVIKNGVAYDKRYNPRKIRFDRPRIFVFTNCLPSFELMSKDRWNVHSIYNDALKPVDIGDDQWLSD